MPMGLTMTRMKFRRLVLEWSQDKLGSVSGVAQADISRFENLRAKPYDGQAERLAQILGLDPKELQGAVSSGDQEFRSTSGVVPAGGAG